MLYYKHLITSYQDFFGQGIENILLFVKNYIISMYSFLIEKKEDGYFD